MSTQALQLARLFTPGYAARINVQLVYPAQSVIVKPSELSSALVRPLQTARYEPHRSAEYLAATLAYGMIQGHPFMDGNKRTAFFLANEYLRAQGLPGLVDQRRLGGTFKNHNELADRFVGVAASQLDLEDLVNSISMDPEKH